MRQFASRAWGSVLRYLRPAWLLLAIGGGGWFVVQHWREISAQPLDARALAMSFILSLAAKPFAAIQVRLSLQQVGRPLSAAAAIHAYAVADVTKYAPGGIWAVLSRVDLYRRIGMGPKLIFQALVIEQAWLVGSATALGVALYLVGRGLGIGSAVLAFAALSSWAVALTLGRRLYGKAADVTVPALLGAQAATWLLFGLGFAVLMPGQSDILLLAGAFCLAFAAGLAAPFAPAGLGVREAVVAVLASGAMPASEIVRLLLLSRCVLLAADFAFAAVAIPLTRSAWRDAQP